MEEEKLGKINNSFLKLRCDEYIFKEDVYKSFHFFEDDFYLGKV